MPDSSLKLPYFVPTNTKAGPQAASSRDAPPDDTGLHNHGQPQASGPFQEQTYLQKQGSQAEELLQALSLADQADDQVHATEKSNKRSQKSRGEAK